MSHTPRIFVQSLAAYNAGKIVGDWIEVDTDEYDLADAIEALRERLGLEDDECMIACYEGMPSLGEHPDLGELAKMAELIDDHGLDAVNAAYEFSSSGEDLESMLDSMQCTDDLRDWALEIAQDSLELTDSLVPYFDIDAFLRDLSHDYSISDRQQDGNFYIFSY